MLKYGITETAYTDYYGFEAGIRRMAEHGYCGLDYQEFINTETPLFEKSARAFEQYLLEQRKIIEEAGLTVYQAHGPWRWPPRDSTPEDRAERMEKIRRSLEGTAALGCSRFVYHPLLPFGKNDMDHADETWSVNLPFMQEMADYAAGLGITVCLENMPWPEFSIAKTSEILEMIRAVNRPNFKFCLDTGHCAITGDSPADCVRLAGKEQLEALHIHDNDGKRDLHLLPFSKSIDFTAFGKALYEIGFDGVVSLESLFCKNLPSRLREAEEKLLVEKIRYIARIAAGEE